MAAMGIPKLDAGPQKSRRHLVSLVSSDMVFDQAEAKYHDSSASRLHSDAQAASTTEHIPHPQNLCKNVFFRDVASFGARKAQRSCSIWTEMFCVVDG